MAFGVVYHTETALPPVALDGRANDVIAPRRIG